MAENQIPSQKLPINNTTQQEYVNNNNQEQIDNVLSGPGYTGSMQQILAQNTGNRVAIDFLVGTNNIVRKEGILYLVGVSYVVLYNNRDDTYTVCNLYSIEFVTFFTPEGMPRTTPALKRV